MSLEKFKHVLTRLKELWRRQPEIVSVRPIGFKNPVRKISFDAVVLDSDERPRTLSIIGDSKGVTFKPEWIDRLNPPFRLHLLQTDKKLVLVEETIGGDRDE